MRLVPFKNLVSAVKQAIIRVSRESFCQEFKILLKARLSIAGLVTVVVVVIVVNFLRFQSHFNHMLEECLLCQARTTTELFVSMREFMAKNQDKINHDSKGNFEFKQLNPAAVGRGVGDIHNRKGGVRIKQTRLQVRHPANIPDEFEKAALARFEKDKPLKEITGRTELEGRDFFRYMRPLTPTYFTRHCGEILDNIDKNDHISV